LPEWQAVKLTFFAPWEVICPYVDYYVGLTLERWRIAIMVYKESLMSRWNMIIWVIVVLNRTVVDIG